MIRITVDTDSESEKGKTGQSRLDVERRLLQDISRYYPLDDSMWTRPTLLARGKDGRFRCTLNIPLTCFLISGGSYASTGRLPE
jgi:hypothetical protein